VTASTSFGSFENVFSPSSHRLTEGKEVPGLSWRGLGCGATLISIQPLVIKDDICQKIKELALSSEDYPATSN
jgi:hypothetical protein